MTEIRERDAGRAESDARIARAVLPLLEYRRATLDRAIAAIRELIATQAASGVAMAIFAPLQDGKQPTADGNIA